MVVQFCLILKSLQTTNCSTRRTCFPKKLHSKLKFDLELEYIKQRQMFRPKKKREWCSKKYNLRNLKTFAQQIGCNIFYIFLHPNSGHIS